MEMAVRNFLSRQQAAENPTISGGGPAVVLPGGGAVPGVVGGGGSGVPTSTVVGGAGAVGGGMHADYFGDVQAEAWVRYAQFLRELVKGMYVCMHESACGCCQALRAR